MIIDVYCEDCHTVFEYDKKNDDPIECDNCKSHNTRRKWGPVVFDIATGLHGTSRDGYSTGVTYHIGKFTPRTKRGIKIR